jgi:uncharacterized protein (TIGR03000 family)
MQPNRQRLWALLTVVAVFAAIPLLGGQDTPAPATITVVVPADAVITFDGHPTTEKGTQRQYATPPLKPGQTYHYAVVARWTANGQPVEKTRTVDVTSGASVRIDFLRKAGEATFVPGELAGKVRGAGKPISGSTVTLYAAGKGKPMQLAQAQTGADGTFKMDVKPGDNSAAGKVLYLVARGGTPQAAAGKGPNDAIGLMAVLGITLPKKVTVNEFTTIASVTTCAQFLKGEALSGKPLGLGIAAGNVPNFVDLETGGYGATIADALNSAQTPTMANFATLASLTAGCITQVKPDACSRFFAAATSPTGRVPTDTLTAVESITRYPWHQPEKVFALLNDFYPVPKGKNLRPTPFMPYLSWAPSAWIFPLKFTGGGYSAAGKMMVDSEGNVWTGDNWIVGAQNQDSLWDGNVSKFAPNGKPLSPMVTGFTGGGVEGVGFGMAIDAQDNCWVTTYGSKTIAKFDKTGKPLSPPEGYNFGGKLGLMQGIIATPSGDIWALDLEHSQVVYMPKGDPAKGQLLFVNKTGNPKENPGRLAGPFHLAIDQQDRIWVSNAIGDWVTRFPAADPSPSKVETFKTGSSPSGLAVDSKGNVWITCRLGTSKMGREILGKMVEVAVKGGNPDPILTRAMAELRTAPEGGSVTVLQPDGKEAPCSPISGKGLVGPWSAAVDGDDNVWIASFGPATAGIVHLCGANPKAWPPGKKMGDAISPPGGYVGGGMQMLIDIAIDPAGNVWVDNNWQNIDAALERAPEPLSTLGAGQGVVVFYGLAKPVRTPLIGPVQQP